MSTLVDSNDETYTPLSLAAAENVTEVCKLILEHLENVENKNPVDSVGETPYHYAAENGNLTLCKLFAKVLEDKNPESHFGWTPLHTAARCGHLAFFKFIFKTIKYKEPETSDGRTPLKVAIQFEHYDICQFIKDSRSSKDSVNHL